jgi:DNA-binding response OmpR family regulator
VIKSVVRRTSPYERPREITPLYEGINFDQIKGRIQLNNKDISLTASEFKTLKTLIEANGKIVSRYSLAESVYEDLMRAEKHSPSNTIEVFINRVRDKLGLLDRNAVIETVYAEGYRWVQGQHNADRLRPVGATCTGQNLNPPPAGHVPR